MASVKDPVCGMTIDTESAAGRVEVQGETYYFCSASCRQAFEADPDRYVRRAQEAGPRDTETRAQLEQHEPPYTTWGFFTSPKFGAAGSGGLEYERLPEAHGPNGERE